ncbi:unc-13-like protein [Thalictrum thalictroides]|uniref:Unc-13-like protein n=1 Tax=Thalictrum thalictroides TaxID=46969 RepID=A0A7J6VCA9_THATH|nr:unc-13-like protein [Thalictrum thalictroides]
MESTTSQLLVRYRDDRRKLLEFILSSKQPKTSSSINSSIDDEIDSISVDYVLNCINSGEVLHLSKASNKYREESSHPVTVDCLSGGCYFLCSDPDLSGSPPQRVPPNVYVEKTSDPVLYSSNQLDAQSLEEIENLGDEDGYRYIYDADDTCQPMNDEYILSLGLPVPRTGLSDDDMREKAYELLLTCMIVSGIQLYSFEEKKKDKKARFLSRLKSSKEKMNSQPQTSEIHDVVLNIIRSQMQISGAMDACFRRSLMQCASSLKCRQFDLPHISLELLNVVGKYDFPSEKLYIQWKRRQANFLEELLYYSSSLITDELARIRNFIAKISNDEQSDRRTPSELVNILVPIKKFSLKMSSMPGKFDIPDETYYWTSAYHLNINLYEKLLSSVFDILDESQLVEEADEILRVIKMSWVTLGINQKVHDALYGWVFFQKFVETGETKLLDNAILEIQKVQLRSDDEKQEAYMRSLVCSIGINGRKMNVSLVDVIFLSISIWCSRKLRDYHKHFSQKAIDFEKVLRLYTLVGVFSAEESGDIKLIKPKDKTEVVSRHLRGCIGSSIDTICRRLCHVIDTKKNGPKLDGKHPMAHLADELLLIAEKESTVFSPVLGRWCPEAGLISIMQLHNFYGKKLKPFLVGVTCLSDEVRSVLPAADMLDWKLAQLYYSARCEDKLQSPLSKDLDHYQIGEICKPIILDWVNGQHAHILEWTERAFDLEDWEPLSFHQRHAASIIEVFRILEEAVDQLFSLKIPLELTHLQSLLSVIFQSLESYLLKMDSQLVEKNHLFPAAPALTRYKEAVIPSIKKKSINTKILDENILNKLKRLTVSKLCVRLNTLQYIESKLSTLEDGIKESWALVRPCLNERWAKEQFLRPLGDCLPKCRKSVDGLFITFNKIRQYMVDAVNKVCELIGARLVFWDLRDSFLFTLYRGKIENARLENSLLHFDSVLDHICSTIIDSLRDRVVLSICRASMDGYIWVLLEGGPSRAFLETDIQLLQEDLDILKDFFVADGDGLPPAVVEQEAIIAQSIIHLYSLQSETLIGMLMIASEQVSTKSDCTYPGGWCVEDAHTLLRVLCHRKDTDASTFLKRQYQLPNSSEYEDTSTVSSPLISDLLNRSKSSHWAKKTCNRFTLGGFGIIYLGMSLGGCTITFGSMGMKPMSSGPVTQKPTLTRFSRLPTKAACPSIRSSWDTCQGQTHWPSTGWRPDLSIASTSVLNGEHGSLSQRIPMLPYRHNKMRMFEPPRASKDVPTSFRFPPMTKKPKWYWRMLACLPYLMPLHETWMYAETAYHLHPFLEDFEFLTYPFLEAIGRLPSWFLMAYFFVAYLGVVRKKEWPHFFRFHVVMGMLLEIALQVVGTVSRWMPLAVYWGKVGMHFWTAVSFGYLFTVLECIRCALGGMYADVPFVCDAAYIQIPYD